MRGHGTRRADFAVPAGKRAQIRYRATLCRLANETDDADVGRWPAKGDFRAAFTIGVQDVTGFSHPRERTGRRGWRGAAGWRNAALVTAAAAALALVLPGGVSSARTKEPSPSLSSLVAQAKQLSFQINALSEQYDGLRIQLASARAEAKKAQRTAAEDAAALKKGRIAVAHVAAASYMNAGLDPTIQLLISG